METLTMLAYLMEGKTLYYGDEAIQYDPNKEIILCRKPNKVWAFTNFCVSDFIKLSKRGLFTLTPDPSFWGGN